MSSTEHFPLPIVGASGEPCAACGTPLAADQRYCLNCGTRRGGPRLPYQEYLSNSRATAASTDNGVAAAPVPRGGDVSPLGVVFGIALLGGMLLIGVLLGRGTDDSSQSQPQVVTVGSEQTTTPSQGAATTPEPSPSADVVSDWPTGQDGWTVELGTLDKAGTTADDVDATKSDLTNKGATDVGVLDSDLYPSLPGGAYVLYSGVYDSKQEATAALKDLSDFADALVVEVSATPSAGVPESEVPHGEVSGDNGAVVPSNGSDADKK
jgi:hypothetical protein